ncbi:unnamed protein product [Clonostachys rhizophaga]|uniref:Glycoside hydrolase family 5 domain-containing protein n=1 Tax=Clonostachys rhizophaga TaxID=160324 RepID=A0A9N9YPU0_9HYPO|nr:unnamed protein product [Clonostachys rhizophaga]
MFLLNTSAALAALFASMVTAFPNLPFVVDGPKMIDTTGASVKFAGTNWPGHGEVMIPEGLQYQSIEKIVSDIKSLGMNAVRLTYAIEMIDQIYANDGEDIDIKTAFTAGLGATNGTVALNSVLANNPQFTESTTRLEVYDAVTKELAKNEIYVNLDNHMSSGKWCCSGGDGNTWWGDTYFDADNWVRGLSYMANHGLSWSNLASMSLRNELRQPTNNEAVKATYNWETWYKHIREGSAAVHAANPDVLVILSGLNYDTTMQPVVRGQALSPGTATFSFDDFAGFKNKLVIELHNYDRSASSCSALSGSLYNGGAQAMNPDEASTVNVFPVLVTEFGFPQDGSSWQTVYVTCLAEWMPNNTAGWFQWVVVGSYMIRSGVQDYDESWGLYNHDWSAWRDSAYINNVLIPSVEATVGDGCRFEHPSGGNRNQTSNRFGGGGNVSGNQNALDKYKISVETIEADLTTDTPQWILSAYAPGKDPPEQLFGGFPREQSFEEMRFHFYQARAAGNEQQALNQAQELYQTAQQQNQNALRNIRDAMNFIVQGENRHPNRHDLCNQGTQGQPFGEFLVGKRPKTTIAEAAAANPFSSNNSNTPSAFGGGAATGSSAFGQPSTLGQRPSAFGAPAFGQPSQPTSTFGQSAQPSSGGSAFGQPSQPSSTFGQPSQPSSAFGQSSQPSSAFGQPSQPASAFGQPSALGAKPSPFGAPSFGQPSQPNAQGSAFGQPSQLGQKPNPFSTATPSPFGSNTNNAPAANPFGGGGSNQNNTATNAFGGSGNNQAQSNPSPFGQPSQNNTQGSAFGQPSALGQKPNPFAAAQPPAQDGNSPFGAKPAAPSGFSQKPQENNPFAQPANAGAAPANPFGTHQPQQNVETGPQANPYPSDSTRQHPPLDSYASKGMDGRLTMFKGKPVTYKDGLPGIRQFDGTWQRIWFPNGPPSFYKDTALPLEKSDDKTKAQWAAFAQSGNFADGVMPALPPPRDCTLWNF